MWICLSDAFLSIVDNSNVEGELLVRARRKGDIEKVFPTAKVVESAGRDYLYRAGIKREDVAAAVAQEVMELTYPNFKGSVMNKELHSAYARVWHIMSGLQEIPPYSTTKRQDFRYELKDLLDEESSS